MNLPKFDQFLSPPVQLSWSKLWDWESPPFLGISTPNRIQWPSPFQGVQILWPPRDGNYRLPTCPGQVKLGSDKWNKYNVLPKDRLLFIGQCTLGLLSFTEFLYFSLYAALATVNICLQMWKVDYIVYFLGLLLYCGSKDPASKYRQTNKYTCRERSKNVILQLGIMIVRIADRWHRRSILARFC